MSAAVKPTRDEFLEQRSPVRGRSNPEKMQKPVWEWLVREECNAYVATETFDGPNAMDAGPGWCFDRFGCSETELRDGRIVHISGEHEDFYDPDFYIYNDVIVKHPDGGIEIFGYPDDVFPPTDFHTATLIGDRIILIGSLGYMDRRYFGTTPVLALDLETFAISALPTTGDCPGWIHKHRAELEDDGATIVVTGGVIYESDETIYDNVDEWALSSTTGIWSRRTRRPWQEWQVSREDGEILGLFDMSQVAWGIDHPELAYSPSEENDRFYNEIDLEPDPAKRLEEEGRRFHYDTYRSLYVPASFDARIEERENYPVQAAYSLGDAVVSYEESNDDVRIKIEGKLPESRGRELAEELRDKLQLLENSPCEVSLVGRSAPD